MQIQLRSIGPASITTAWQRYVRPSQWPSWAFQIRAVHIHPVGPLRSDDAICLGTGMTGSVQSFGPIRIPFEITQVDPAAYRWQWVVQILGQRVHMTHRLDVMESGTRTELDIKGPAVIVAAYAPVARVALRRLLSDPPHTS